MTEKTTTTETTATAATTATTAATTTMENTATMATTVTATKKKSAISTTTLKKLSEEHFLFVTAFRVLVVGSVTLAIFGTVYCLNPGARDALSLRSYYHYLARLRPGDENNHNRNKRKKNTKTPPPTHHELHRPEDNVIIAENSNTMTGLFVEQQQQQQDLLLNDQEEEEEAEDAAEDEDDGEWEDDPFDLTWLMSFPSSGSTYLLDVTRKISGNAVASNFPLTDRLSPVQQQQSNDENNKMAQLGPWFVASHDDTTQELVDGMQQVRAYASNTVLTSTYCGSHCGNWCTPDRFANATVESFLQACLETMHMEPKQHEEPPQDEEKEEFQQEPKVSPSSIRGWNLVQRKQQERAQQQQRGRQEQHKQRQRKMRGGGGYVPVNGGAYYNPDAVKKVVHVVRHPLDHIVARFRAERKKQGPRFRRDFDDSTEGFRSWCNSMDTYDPIAQSPLVQYYYTNHGNQVLPCLAEFIKYVKWHNLAFETSKYLNVPTVVLRIEDLDDERHRDNKRRRRVLHRLFRFIGVPQKVVDQRLTQAERDDEFEWLSSAHYYYDDGEGYYSEDEKIIIRGFLATYASDETWRHLKEYDFDD